IVRLFKIDEDVRELLRYSRKYTKYQKTIFSLSPFLLFLIATIDPFLVRYLFDNIITKLNFSKLPLFVLIFFIAKAAEKGISVVVNYNFLKCANVITYIEQNNLLKKISRLPIKKLKDNAAGTFLSRATSDVPQLAEAINTVIPGIVVNLVLLVMIGAVLLYFSWQLAIIVFLTVPLYTLSVNSFNKALKNSSTQERERNGEIIEDLREDIEGAATVKKFVKEDYLTAKFERKANEWLKVKNKYSLIMQVIDDFLTFVRGISPIIVLSYGGFLVMKGTITLGTLIGFYNFMNWIYDPVRVISRFSVSLRTSVPVYKRIKEIYDMEEEADGNTEINNVEEVRYEDVYFSYDHTPILKDISFEIKNRQKLAIVGMSGSGKSTLVSLLPRYYEPERGSIRINDVEIRNAMVGSLRKRVIVVQQNDFIFNTSIRENITLGDEFSEEEFERAVKAACVDEFAESLDEKYETVVGANGSHLSDGQRQRIAIARAVIRKPELLVLDESTSGVDSKTEERIFEKLSEVCPTLIIISHRLSTIGKADEIIVMEEGQIVERGTHEELVNKDSAYKRIIRSQIFEK
ncbi:MAG TPA: ABC transporter ATP-binding protein, partial [Fervidobacterium sp.]|nr:ABC transporter ATP-binding protein [Fervidobacterium sp.]